MVSQNADFSGLPGITHIINKVEPTRDYPKGFQGLSSWNNQLERLHQLFEQKLNPDGIAARAQAYLDAKNIWKASFSSSGPDKRVFDGLVISANPFAVAKKLGIGDLVEDLGKATNGSGLWGTLCNQIIFPVLAKQQGGFTNWREGQMGSDRFLPLREVAEWLYQCYQTEGDFIVRPCSAGRCMAGYATESSRVAVQQYHGIVACSWVGGQLLITHPNIVTPQSLFHDYPGDGYRFGDGRTFHDAPYFDRGDAGLGFDTRSVGRASGDCGSVFLSRE